MTRRGGGGGGRGDVTPLERKRSPCAYVHGGGGGLEYARTGRCAAYLSRNLYRHLGGVTNIYRFLSQLCSLYGTVCVGRLAIILPKSDSDTSLPPQADTLTRLIRSTRRYILISTISRFYPALAAEFIWPCYIGTIEENLKVHPLSHQCRGIQPKCWVIRSFNLIVQSYFVISHCQDSSQRAPHPDGKTMNNFNKTQLYKVLTQLYKVLTQLYKVISLSVTVKTRVKEFFTQTAKQSITSIRPVSLNIPAGLRGRTAKFNAFYTVTNASNSSFKLVPLWNNFCYKSQADSIEQTTQLF